MGVQGESAITGASIVLAMVRGAEKARALDVVGVRKVGVVDREETVNADIMRAYLECNEREDAMVKKWIVTLYVVDRPPQGMDNLTPEEVCDRVMGSNFDVGLEVEHYAIKENTDDRNTGK